jgi:arabinofuranosyltransferase
MVTRRPVWRYLAFAIIGVLALWALLANSLVVDGTRYFWLDDDLMISMRYARNLATGHGPVWNPGEHVEGYTNPLWMAVMAVVHLLQVGDAKSSLVIRLVNLALMGWVLVLAERLLRRLLPDPGLALPALLLPLALCYDLLYWGLHGFETTLLTAVFLLFLARVLDEEETGISIGTWLLLGLLPLIRSDAHALFAAGALFAVSVAHDRSRALRGVAIAAIAPVAHLAFRYAYYGELLPNTYYLKVAGNSLAVRLRAGASYVAYFSVFYWMYALLSGIGAWAGGKGVKRTLLLSLLVPIASTVWVGGDMYFGARFLAPLVPVLMVVALATVRDVCAGREPAERALIASLVLSTFVGTGFLLVLGAGFSLIRLDNGGPVQSLITALTIAKNAGPDAKVAVHAAGMVPYFSRRPAIDVLGKTDPVVARLPAMGPEIGHNKLDPAHSLGGLAPDLVVMLWLPHGFGECTERDRALVESAAPPWVAAIYLSGPFQRDYCGTAIEIEGGDPIYFRRSSPETARRASWQPVRTGS